MFSLQLQCLHWILLTSDDGLGIQNPGFEVKGKFLQTIWGRRGPTLPLGGLEYFLVSLYKYIQKPDFSNCNELIVICVNIKQHTYM